MWIPSQTYPRTGWCFANRCVYLVSVFNKNILKKYKTHA